MRRALRLLLALAASVLVLPQGVLAQTTQAPVTSDGSSAAPLVLLAAAGVLLVLAALVWAAARWWAFEPPWVLRARHAAGEAGWRTNAAWADFRDWLRLGR